MAKKISTVRKFSTAEFKGWVTDLKSRIRQSQLKAAVRVNGELLRLYWSMGRDIVERQMDAGYGSRFFEMLSRELRNEFPEMAGFSVVNLTYCKRFYLFYAQGNTIRQQPVDELPDAPILQQLAANLQVAPKNDIQILQQPVEELAVTPIRPQLVDEFKQSPILHQAGEEFEINPIFQVPWGHHIQIFTQCATLSEALFYVRKTVENGWSRAVLMNFIEADLYAAQGKAPNNFSRLLPEPQSDLASEVLKDPYNFDFLTLAENYRERELETALAENIVKFLLALGRGFTFYGRQVPLKAGDEELFADMVFYHLGLRCFVIVELKARPFEPAFAGQLGAYVAAANHQLKTAHDRPTIGLLICKTKNRVLAQYALESSSQPIGISDYKLSRLLPKQLQTALPDIAEIERKLSGGKSGGRAGKK